MTQNCVTQHESWTSHWLCVWRVNVVLRRFAVLHGAAPQPLQGLASQHRCMKTPCIFIPQTRASKSVTATSSTTHRAKTLRAHNALRQEPNALCSASVFSQMTPCCSGGRSLLASMPPRNEVAVLSNSHTDDTAGAHAGGQLPVNNMKPTNVEPALFKRGRSMSGHHSLASARAAHARW